MSAPQPVPAALDLAALKTFPSISADAFQHPDDRRATQALQQVPFFPQIVRAVYSGFLERVARLDQVGNSIRLGPNQGRSLYRLFVRAAEILQINELPEIYLSGDFALNATAFGVKKYTITLYAPLVSILTEAEVMAIIGHELGHVKCGHMANKTIAHFLANFGASALGSVVPVLGPAAAAGLAVPLMYWSRMAELSCDRAGLVVVQDPNVVASALSKLAGWSVRGIGELNLTEIDQQLQEYESSEQDVLDGVAKIKHSMDTLYHSHPLPILRIQKIRAWGKSDQFTSILSGDYPKITAAPAQKSPGTAHCLACGHPLTPGDEFCGFCGEAFVTPAGVPLCPNDACRKPIVPGQRFCSKCGVDLSSAASGSSGPAVA